MELIDHYDGESGKLILTMPPECAEGCSAPGQHADDEVAWWVDRVKWHADSGELRRICKSTGAWEDCLTADLETIKKRVLWMVACEWREENQRNN